MKDKTTFDKIIDLIHLYEESNGEVNQAKINVLYDSLLILSKPFFKPNE